MTLGRWAKVKIEKAELLFDLLCTSGASKQKELLTELMILDRQERMMQDDL